MLAILLDVPSDQAGWDRFGFHNRISHDAINKAIQGKQGPIIPDPVTYPIDLLDRPAWLERHALEHQQMTAALHTVSADFSLLNWDDPSAVAQWIAIHSLEHQAVEAALGIAS